MDTAELFGYKNKNVLVTGAFSGMGKAAARLLSELGANVYAVCRRNGRHSELDFPICRILHADLGEKRDLDNLADEIPDNLFAVFFCQGIALNSQGTTYFLPVAITGKRMPKIVRNFWIRKHMKINSDGAMSTMTSLLQLMSFQRNVLISMWQQMHSTRCLLIERSGSTA